MALKFCYAFQHNHVEALNLNAVHYSHHKALNHREITAAHLCVSLRHRATSRLPPHISYFVAFAKVCHSKSLPHLPPYGCIAPKARTIESRHLLHWDMQWKRGTGFFPPSVFVLPQTNLLPSPIPCTIPRTIFLFLENKSS